MQRKEGVLGRMALRTGAGLTAGALFVGGDIPMAQAATEQQVPPVIVCDDTNSVKAPDYTLTACQPGYIKIEPTKIPGSQAEAGALGGRIGTDITNRGCIPTGENFTYTNPEGNPLLFYGATDPNCIYQSPPPPVQGKST